MRLPSCLQPGSNQTLIAGLPVQILDVKAALEKERGSLVASTLVLISQGKVRAVRLVAQLASCALFKSRHRASRLGRDVAKQSKAT